MNEVLSPIATQGVLGALLVASLLTNVWLLRGWLAEKDARNAVAERMTGVLFPHIEALKAAAARAVEREADERRKAEIRAIQDEATRDREQAGPARRLPSGHHRPFGGGGTRDGE
jgi:hypothetical protein